jgi:uncharacterized protein (DUF1330 family)
MLLCGDGEGVVLAVVQDLRLLAIKPNREEVMKTYYTAGLSMLAGIAVGGLAIQGLHAQAKAPTYVVIDIASMTEGFKVVPASPGAKPERLTALGGRYIMRTEAITALDGTPPKRFVVLAFDSKEKAQGWANAPDVKETNAMRVKTTNSRSFMVEGLN